MGQRLVINVVHNKNVIASIYYHWSAYTVASLHEVRDILATIPNAIEDERMFQLELIRFCERNGGGIDGGNEGEEWQYVQFVFPNEQFKIEPISRNNGLIDISDVGIDMCHKWSEGDVEIDYDEHCIRNSIYWFHDSLDDYNEEMCLDGEDKLKDISKLPDITFNFDHIDFDELDDVIEILEFNDMFKDGNHIYTTIG